MRMYIRWWKIVRTFGDQWRNRRKKALAIKYIDISIRNYIGKSLKWSYSSTRTLPMLYEDSPYTIDLMLFRNSLKSKVAEIDRPRLWMLSKKRWIS